MSDYRCRNCGHDADDHSGTYTQIEGHPFRCGHCSVCVSETGTLDAGMYPFDPDWCVEPGATLRDIIAESGAPTVEHFAVTHEIDVVLIESVLRADPITGTLARRLSDHVGSSPQFWLNLERHFRDGLASGKIWRPSFDNATRPWLPGFKQHCSWRARRHDCGPPVIMQWRGKVGYAGGNTRTGGWYALCAACAARNGVRA